MGKKMKFIPSLFKNIDRQWPLCKQPKTLSFRARDEVFKSVTSVFFDHVNQVETTESLFTNSEPPRYSIESIGYNRNKPLEMILDGVDQSERMFFEPGETSSILMEAKPAGFPFKESIAVVMDSENAYLDFKSSMEEMVETHGLKDWESLEEMLGWYLWMNEKMNHGFIVGAFVDLLVGLSATCSDYTSFSSATSFSSYSPIAPVAQKDIGEEDTMAMP